MVLTIPDSACMQITAMLEFLQQLSRPPSSTASPTLPLSRIIHQLVLPMLGTACQAADPAVSSAHAASSMALGIALTLASQAVLDSSGNVQLVASLVMPLCRLSDAWEQISGHQTATLREQLRGVLEQAMQFMEPALLRGAAAEQPRWLADHIQVRLLKVQTVLLSSLLGNLL